jgi:hypothetical protein
MDLTNQIAESDATGFDRGLYADIRSTFRAPVVNSIWRTLLANEPALTRHIWGQTKPAFETREFAAFSVAFRDRILSAVEPDAPRYEPADVGLDPAAVTELRGQLAAFDAVAPRLAVLFALVTRRLDGRPVGTENVGEAAAAPFPEWLDADRGRPPTMVSHDEARAVIPDDVAGDFGEMVPSVYRCLAQWPAYLERASADLRPVLGGESFRETRRDAFGLVETYLDPDGLAAVGATPETVDGLRDLFGTFLDGGREILPLLHVYAATVGAAGERRGVAFP